MFFRTGFLIAVFLCGWSQNVQAAPAVVASLAPVHSVAAAVMEGVGEPELLLSPAVSVHDYQLKPSDMLRLSRADVLFWGGPVLESFLPKAITAAELSEKNIALLADSRIKTYRARSLDGEESGIDGHFWLDPLNMAATAEIMAEKLAEMDVENADLYRQNAARFSQNMKRLKENNEAALKPYLKKPYVVFHDAYQYFEKSFGLTSLGVVSADAHHVVGARYLIRLREKMKQAGRVCLFAEPQFSDKRVSVVAQDLPVVRGVLDPLGGNLTPGRDFYPALIDHLTQSFVQCFAGLPV